jgi:hypothetical protein
MSGVMKFLSIGRRKFMLRVSAIIPLVMILALIVTHRLCPEAPINTSTRLVSGEKLATFAASVHAQILHQLPCSILT